MKKFILLITLLLTQNCFSSNFSVFPLFLELDQANRAKQSFEINVQSEGPLKIQFSLYKAEQDKDGKLYFQKVEKNNLVKFKKNRHTFSRKSAWTLKGEFTFSKKNTTDVYAVMIEEQMPEKKQGISIQVRYAVVLKTQNSNKRVFEKALLNAATINKNNTLKISFTNQTEKEQNLDAKFFIRNASRKLVASGPLKTLSAWQKGSKTSIVFPRNQVNLVSKPINVSESGLYTISVRGRINKKRNISFTKQIQIERSLPATQKKEPQIVKLNPPKLNVALKKNNTALFRFQIVNNKNKDIQIELPTSKQGFKFIPSKLQIKKGKSKNVLFKITKFDQSIDFTKMYAQILNKKNEKLPLNISIKKGQ